MIRVRGESDQCVGIANVRRRSYDKAYSGGLWKRTTIDDSTSPDPIKEEGLKTDFTG